MKTDDRQSIAGKKTKSASSKKNEEIRNLVQQRVVQGIDPFADSLTSFWPEAAAKAKEKDNLGSDLNAPSVSSDADTRDDSIVLTDESHHHTSKGLTLAEMLKEDAGHSSLTSDGDNLFDGKEILSDNESIIMTTSDPLGKSPEPNNSMNTDISPDSGFVLSEIEPESAGTNMIPFTKISVFPVHVDSDVKGGDEHEFIHEQNSSGIKSSMNESMSEQKNSSTNFSMPNFMHARKNRRLNLDLGLPIQQQVLSIVNNLKNFALVGFLTYLNTLYPNGRGRYSIKGLADLAGMTRPTVKNALETLQQKRFISIEGDEVVLNPPYRWCMNLSNMDNHIHAEIPSGINLSMTEFIHENKSSIMQNSVTDTFSDSSGINLSMNKSVPSLYNNSNNKTIITEGDTYLDMNKFKHMPSWEQATWRSRAEELFLIAVATNSLKGLSSQALGIFRKIHDDHGREFAGGLFLSLLKKTLDSPTGYVAVAIKKGAQPLPADIERAKQIFVISSVNELQSIDQIKIQIKEAVDKNDLAKVTKLSESSSHVTKCLRHLGWTGTVEELKAEHRTFMHNLFGVEYM